MTRQRLIERLTTELSDVIDKWIDGLPEDVTEQFGWHGNDESRLMARAAVNVIEASMDVQATMRENGVEVGA